MKIKAIITSTIFTLALFTGSALAADRGATTDDPARDYQGDPIGERGGALEPRPGTPMAEPGQDRQDEFFQAEADDNDRIAGMHRAGELMGQTVVSQQGNEIGTIDELVISENGQVEYIVLSRGGTLGIGGVLVPVPWEAANLQWDQENDQLRADITEQQLEGAPTFDGDNWAQITAPDYEQQVHSYFGTEPRQDQRFQSPQVAPQPGN
jgi:hypothetical protein